MRAAEIASCLLQYPNVRVVDAASDREIEAVRRGKHDLDLFLEKASNGNRPEFVQHVVSDPIVPLVSPRGFMLVGCAPPATGRPIITVELYEKWYTLFVVHPSGAITELTYETLRTEGFERTLYVDHVPNPKAVEAYAKSVDFVIDPLAHELIHGRWQLEVESTS